MNCAILLKALRDARLTRTDLAILGALIRIEGPPPSRKEVAAAAGCAASSVPRSARKLEELGYVEREIDARDHGGRAKPTGYRLKADTCPDGYVPASPHSDPDTLDAVFEEVERPQNPALRIEPDTGQIPPKDNNQTPREFYPEPVELAEPAAAAARRLPEIVLPAVSDTPPPPAWQRVADAVASRWLDPNKSTRLVEEGAMVQRWIDAGADEARDIVPTVRRMCAAKAEPIATWRFFAAAVVEATKRRLAAERHLDPITPSEASNEHAPSAPRYAPGSTTVRRKHDPVFDAIYRDEPVAPPIDYGRVDFSSSK